MQNKVKLPCLIRILTIGEETEARSIKEGLWSSFRVRASLIGSRNSFCLVFSLVMTRFILLLKSCSTLSPFYLRLISSFTIDSAADDGCRIRPCNFCEKHFVHRVKLMQKIPATHENASLNWKIFNSAAFAAEESAFPHDTLFDLLSC